MIVPDVNLLLYAHFKGFAEHRAALEWWTALMNGERLVGIAPAAAFGFVRIATNPRVIERPMSFDVAQGHVETWLMQPHVQLAHGGPQHLEIAFGLLRALGVAGNLTTDAQLAALALEHQGEVHSNDGDFARFPGLRDVNPLA